MIQRQPAAAILVDQRERRAADLVRIDAEALGQAAHERRLAGAEVPGQQQHVAGLESQRQLARDGARFFFGVREATHVSRGAGLLRRSLL